MKLFHRFSKKKRVCCQSLNLINLTYEVVVVGTRICGIGNIVFVNFFGVMLCVVVTYYRVILFCHYVLSYRPMLKFLVCLEIIEKRRQRQMFSAPRKIRSSRLI